jgi:hypothetical protein
MLLNQFIDISTFWQSQVGRTRKHHIYEIKLLGNIEGTTKNGQHKTKKKQNKNATQYVLDTTIRQKTQIT